jgi:CrcB protein
MRGIVTDPGSIRVVRRPGRRRVAAATLPRVGRDLDVLAVIAAGGALGALARWGVAVVIPHAAPADLPIATLTVNVVGCLLIGILMWLVLEVWGERRYARPFLGVGVLGGFTTFSAFAVEIRGMLVDGAWAVAVGYVVASVVLGLVAVRAGYLLGERITVRSR